MEMFDVGEEVSDICTIARAEYLTNDGLQFKVYRKGRRHLGMQDIESPAFEQEFVFSSSDPTKVEALFSDPVIRQLMLRQTWVSLEARPSANSFELYLDNHNVIIDNIDELRELSELYGLLLEHLCYGGQMWTPSLRQAQG